MSQVLGPGGQPIEKQASRPLEENFGLFGGGTRTTRINPTQSIGRPGTANYSGYVVENEKSGALTERERYRTFSQALANTSIVAASVRYFLNLIAGADWTFEPADHPQGEEMAEAVERILMEDPDTSWARIVRRAAMYRFYGFSIQEWTARRAADGTFTFASIAPRAQLTIERWDQSVDGSVLGVAQRNPQNHEQIYLPRGKLLYLVDDTLNDSPQGLGLFRHIVEPVRRLNRYEQLEGFGFETDLRGIPVGRAPYAAINQAVKNGEITEEQARQALLPIETFIKRHVKKPDLGLLMDSQTYTTTDDATRPSNQRLFDVDILDGSQNSLPEIAAAITRVNLEIARILGTESLLLGDGTAGSFALARDKTTQFSLTADATLDELKDAVRRDLLNVIWRLNGWDVEAMPTIRVEAVQYRSVEEITAAIRDMAQAGAILAPDDPIINHVRGILGAPMQSDMSNELDAGLGGPSRMPAPDDQTIDVNDREDQS